MQIMEGEWWFDSGGLARVGGDQEPGTCVVGSVYCSSNKT